MSTNNPQSNNDTSISLSMPPFTESTTHSESTSLLGQDRGAYDKIETGVSLTWKNVTYKVGKGSKQKTILNNMSGYIRPGQMLGMFNCTIDHRIGL